ncbi:MAG: hypothetical protein HYZ32_01285 [Hydrocarboniphaga effusa]|nr:hypothetical protein [Hydrocarboniphaga effusa]
MADWLREMKVGDWYQASDGSRADPFELVAVDVQNESVLVQHYDGTLEEYDFDSWMELGAKPVSAPEDWTGAMDMDRGDSATDNDLSSPPRWEDPLDLLDQRHS